MNKLISVLFTVTLFELMLGGGGRLVAWGGVSLRMILFSFALFIVGIQILRKQRISKEYWVLSFAFLIVLLIGLLRGLMSGADRAFWWEDVKPLLYFFILPFFGYAIQGRVTIESVAHIIKRSGILLSGIFIVLLILIHTGVIPFLDFYHTVLRTQEFFFRGELTFFYKAFIYICIAFLFVHFSEDKYKYSLLILLAIGILLSFTRGFLFAIALTYASYYFLKSSFVRVTIFVFISLSVVLIGQLAISQGSQAIDQLTNRQEYSQGEKNNPNPNLLGNRAYADEGRFQQIKEVAQQADFSTLLIGHGFGIGIPARPVHMEISYLEIFHKQGLIGLLFWGYLLWALFIKYKDATPDGLSDSFFVGSLFVYFQSLTNQYINNPIGLSMILLSFVCLDQLKKK